MSPNASFLQTLTCPPHLRPPSRNQLNFWTNHRTDPTDSIFVFYSDERKVGVKTMRK